MPEEHEDYDAEADMWRSWWLAHAAIGADVKAGRRELPEMFKSTREGDGE